MDRTSEPVSQAQLNVALIRLALVMVSVHSSKTLTKTPSKNFNPELFLSKGNVGTKNGAETEGKAIKRLWDPSHLQTPNSNTIAHAILCLQTGAWYNCPLRGSAST